MKHHRFIGFLRCIVCLLLGLAMRMPHLQAQERAWSEEELRMILRTLDGKPVEELVAKIDQWMAAEKDSSARVRFAQTAFEHYGSSPIMGYERVALYLADNYLLTPGFGLSDEEEFHITWYTQITRPNQIGATAPDLTFRDPLGYPIPLHRLPGDYLVLWFVDDQCPICQSEYEHLNSWLKEWISQPTCNLPLVRCYVGDALSRWTTYREGHPLPQSDSLSVWDAWDPDFETGFQIHYGVISTPKLFLISHEDLIVGRNLNTESLRHLLQTKTDPNYQKERLHQYFEALFSTILSSSGQDPEEDRWLVQYAIDGLYQQNHEDSKAFREVFYELYQYLKSHPSYLLQEGAVYLGEQYILSQADLWLGQPAGDATFTQDQLDELAFAIAMFRRNPLGTVATDLKLQSLNGSAYWISDSQADYTLLYFYKTDCAACEAFTAELQRILSQFSDQNLQALAIYTGRKGRAWKRYAAKELDLFENLADLNGNSGMFQTYNLSAVPVLYLLDDEKRVIAKDISPFTLEEILNAIYPQ